MLHIAVVDDDMRVVADITNILQLFYKDIVYEQEDFSDGAEFVESLKDNKRYDIVFMDIEMPEINGDEAVRELRKSDADEKTFVVYVSSHTDNIVGLFSLHPFDFVEKPVNQSKVISILQKISKARQDKLSTITVLVNRREQKIVLSDIIYAESEGHRLLIYLKGQPEPLVSYTKMDEFYKLIRENSVDFIRTHTSFVVNRCYVNRYFRDHVLVGSHEIPVSSKYKNKMLVDINNGV